jgi:hypothetical protein
MMVFALIVAFLFRGPTEPAEAHVRSAFVKDNGPSIIQATLAGECLQKVLEVLVRVVCGRISRSHQRSGLHRVAASAVNEDAAHQKSGSFALPLSRPSLINRKWHR